MYILEYVTEWENGESVLNRLECKTQSEVNLWREQAKEGCYTEPDYCSYINHSFRIEEVN